MSELAEASDEIGSCKPLVTERAGGPEISEEVIKRKARCNSVDRVRKESAMLIDNVEDRDQVQALRHRSKFVFNGDVSEDSSDCSIPDESPEKSVESLIIKSKTAYN